MARDRARVDRLRQDLDEFRREVQRRGTPPMPLRGNHSRGVSGPSALFDPVPKAYGATAKRRRSQSYGIGPGSTAYDTRFEFRAWPAAALATWESAEDSVNSHWSAVSIFLLPGAHWCISLNDHLTRGGEPYDFDPRPDPRLPRSDEVINLYDDQGLPAPISALTAGLLARIPTSFSGRPGLTVTEHDLDLSLRLQDLVLRRGSSRRRRRR